MVKKSEEKDDSVKKNSKKTSSEKQEEAGGSLRKKKSVPKEKETKTAKSISKPKKPVARKKLSGEAVIVEESPAAKAPVGKEAKKRVAKPRVKKAVSSRVEKNEVIPEEKKSVDVTVEIKNKIAVEKQEPVVKKEIAEAVVKPQVSKVIPVETAPVAPLTPKEKLKIPQIVTVGELADRLKIKPTELIKKLMQIDIMATINQRLSPDTVSVITDEYGFEAEIIPLFGEEILAREETVDRPEDLQSRPPVVTIMGHVDHGKTSLLDTIRETNVAGGEAGGITQHIGAYKVSLPHGNIVFLDTPGHEAFTAMRARGAQATDIVVLVVAADDGVMPQTIEAINHAKAAGVPIIVAVNKIDLPGANVQRIKQELANYGLASEDWGGKTIYVEVSAKKKINIAQLLEMILLEAEMQELKANPKTKAKGVVIEAKLDRGRGPVATILVQKGTLKQGDIFVVGQMYGKVRALLNDKLEKVDAATPSIPVEVLGLSGLPAAGDAFQVVSDEREARHIASMRQEIKRIEELNSAKEKVKLDELYDQIKEGKIKELKVIIKADVQGSAEAIKESLLKLSHKEIKISVIHTGIGGITESDVILASVSNAIIIGFNVRPPAVVETLAEREKVDIRLYRIIYEVLDDVRKALEGMLEPELKEVKLGRAEVRQVFKVPKGGFVAGSYVLDGMIPRIGQARLVRDSVVIFEGKIGSLRRFKDDVKEVAYGYECGITLENFNDIKAGDVIEAYKFEKIMRKLES